MAKGAHARVVVRFINITIYNILYAARLDYFKLYHDKVDCN